MLPACCHGAASALDMQRACCQGAASAHDMLLACCQHGASGLDMLPWCCHRAASALDMMPWVLPACCHGAASAHDMLPVPMTRCQGAVSAHDMLSRCCQGAVKVLSRCCQGAASAHDMLPVPMTRCQGAVSAHDMLSRCCQGAASAHDMLSRCCQAAASAHDMLPACCWCPRHAAMVLPLPMTLPTTCSQRAAMMLLVRTTCSQRSMSMVLPVPLTCCQGVLPVPMTCCHGAASALDMLPACCHGAASSHDIQPACCQGAASAHDMLPLPLTCCQGAVRVLPVPMTCCQGAASVLPWCCQGTATAPDMLSRCCRGAVEVLLVPMTCCQGAVKLLLVPMTCCQRAVGAHDMLPGCYQCPWHAASVLPWCCRCPRHDTNVLPTSCIGVVAVPGRQQALSTGLERYSTTACRGACHRGLLFGPAASRGSREASVRPWTPSTTPQLGGGERRGSGQRCVTPRQTCPRPDGLGRNLRSKTRWFTGFCNSHQVSHFATFFIDARAEISVAESRFRYRFVHCIPRGTVSGTAGAVRFDWISLARVAPGTGLVRRQGAGRPFVGIPCTASESEACRGGPDRAQRAASGQEREDSSSVRRLPWAGVGRRGTIEGLEFRRTGSQHRNRQLASEAVTALGAAMRSRTSVQFGARARSLRARTTETPLTRHHVHKEQPRQPDHDSPTSAGRAMEATGGAVPAPLGMTGKPGNAGVRHRPRVHRRLRPRGARRASPRKARHVSRGRVDPFETST
ncbi:Protein TAR1 [Quillaja saponaria]|uniref:Protein TAR1 n=1 Tax=Quillaja saponaria TaxID=32244 RepID=A0AAD7KNL5_QUISA|nr:Protein TAR1 [Quillaja saponaria]